MDASMSSRIERMFSRDRATALIVTLVLWVTIVFVYIAIMPLIGSGALRVVLIIGAAALLVFNTASMIAMVKHYREDRDHIYGLDIHHLDEAVNR